MHAHSKLQTLVISLALVSLLLTACGPSGAETTPTMAPELIQTFAVATFSAQLTETALANPTPAPTDTPQPTNTPLATAAQGTPQAAAPTQSCYGLLYVKDVTIPDNTAMTAGQTFTKTWQVKNSGTCAWESGFNFAHIDGDAMNGATLTLSQTVQPGAVIELSIDMTAPNTAGTVTGWWRMSDASGNYFGNALSVVIDVGGATTSQTPTSTSTATPTATPTP
jgi:hypothetical protein